MLHLIVQGLNKNNLQLFRTRVYPPIRIENIKIDLLGHQVVLSTETGISLSYDGTSSITLTLPQTYMGHIQGKSDRNKLSTKNFPNYFMNHNMLSGILEEKLPILINVTRTILIFIFLQTIYFHNRSEHKQILYKSQRRLSR